MLKFCSSSMYHRIYSFLGFVVIVIKKCLPGLQVKPLWLLVVNQVPHNFPKAFTIHLIIGFWTLGLCKGENFPSLVLRGNLKTFLHCFKETTNSVITVFCLENGKSVGYSLVQSVKIGVTITYEQTLTCNGGVIISPTLLMILQYNCALTYFLALLFQLFFLTLLTLLSTLLEAADKQT